QPQLRFDPTIDAYFVRTEDASFADGHSGVHWAAFDPAVGGSIPQSTFDWLPIFHPMNMATSSAHIQRSVFIKNNDSEFTVIGPANASRNRIYETRFVPFQTDLALALDDLDDDGEYLRGEPLTFAITLDNRVPEDSIEHLAVARGATLRISGLTNLTPSFDQG